VKRADPASVTLSPEEPDVNVTCETIDVGPQRLLLFAPVGGPRARLPAVLAYSDIFQHTGPHRRLCQRLAGYGYLVATPELYGRFEPRGTVLDFEKDRQRALDDAGRVTLADLDADLGAAVDFLRGHHQVDPDALAACGWCFGGHVAFRAALRPEVRATACFYPTGLHTDTLGAAQGTARSLAEAQRLRGELLLVWGTRDPHIPDQGRQEIHAALTLARADVQVRVYDAEHTFMRDEGARYEPVSADQAFGDLLALLSPLRGR
jgi:carboxymethylenebutenolidase